MSETEKCGGGAEVRNRLLPSCRASSRLSIEGTALGRRRDRRMVDLRDVILQKAVLVYFLNTIIRSLPIFLQSNNNNR